MSQKVDFLVQNDELERKAKLFIEQSGWDLKSCKLVREFNTFAVKSVDEYVPGSDLRIEGYLSTFNNVDRQKDVVLPGAFDATIKGLKSLPMLMDHVNMVNCQVGSWTDFKIDSRGLYASGSIIASDQTDHLIKLIVGGHIDTLSMGGIFNYANNGKSDSNGNWQIKDVALLEGSIVCIPANPLATFTSKSFLSENPNRVDDSKGAELPASIQERNERITQLLRGKL